VSYVYAHSPVAAVWNSSRMGSGGSAGGSYSKLRECNGSCAHGAGESEGAVEASSAVAAEAAGESPGTHASSEREERGGSRPTAIGSSAGGAGESDDVSEPCSVLSEDGCKERGCEERVMMPMAVDGASVLRMMRRGDDCRCSCGTAVDEGVGDLCAARPIGPNSKAITVGAVPVRDSGCADSGGSAGGVHS